MLKYTDFLLIENFEKELNSFVLNEDIFHPIKTKRIKNALKKYVKAEVEVARFDTESQKRIDKVEGKEAKEKLKQALDKKKEVAQDRIAQIDDTLTANATTDSLKDLVTYGKAAAKEKALDIRAKAEDDLAKKIELEDKIKKTKEVMKTKAEEIKTSVKTDKKNKDSENQ